MKYAKFSRKTWKERTLALLRVFCMTVVMLPTVAFASSGTTGTAVEYSGDQQPLVFEAAGSPYNVTLDNVTIHATDSPAVWIEAGVTVNLTLVGENSLTGGLGVCRHLCGTCIQ